jgi:hypothetical protein
MGFYGRQWRAPGDFRHLWGKRRQTAMSVLHFWLTGPIAAFGRSAVQGQTDGGDAFPLLIRGRRSGGKGLK